METLGPSFGELLQYDGAVEAARIQAVAMQNAAWIQGGLTFVAGIFVIIGGWFSLTGAKHQANAQFQATAQQIRAAEAAENRKLEARHKAVVAAFKAELLVFARPIITTTSEMNRRALSAPLLGGVRFPSFPHPRIFDGLSSELGLLPDGWAIAATIAFYTSLIFVNERFGDPKNDEAGYDSKYVSEELRHLAGNLAQAMDGFTDQEKLLADGFHLNLLEVFMPSGKSAATFQPIPVPLTVQDMLRLVAYGALVDP